MVMFSNLDNSIKKCIFIFLHYIIWVVTYKLLILVTCEPRPSLLWTFFSLCISDTSHGGFNFFTESAPFLVKPLKTELQIEHRLLVQYPKKRGWYAACIHSSYNGIQVQRNECWKKTKIQVVGIKGDCIQSIYGSIYRKQYWFAICVHWYTACVYKNGFWIKPQK